MAARIRMPFSPFFTNRPSFVPRAEAGDVTGIWLLRSTHTLPVSADGLPYVAIVEVQTKLRNGVQALALNHKLRLRPRLRNKHGEPRTSTRSNGFSIS